MNGNEMAAPRPVPDLTVGSVPGEVSDEERNRYGVLLDHAAERGLLTAAEYQVRLAELADATSIERAAAHRHRVPGLRRAGDHAVDGPRPRPPARPVRRRFPARPHRNSTPHCGPA